MALDPAMSDLWRLAILKSQETGIAPAALISGYVRLLQEHAGEQVTPDMLKQVGQDLVANFGTATFLDDDTRRARDEAIQSLADKLGISLEAARGVYDGIAEGVVAYQRGAHTA